MRADKWFGFLVLALLGAVEQACTWPPVAFVAVYGRPPEPPEVMRNLSVTAKGMKAEQVRAKFGPPYRCDSSGPNEVWWYYGASWWFDYVRLDLDDWEAPDSVGLEFDADGCVRKIHVPR